MLLLIILLSCCDSGSTSEKESLDKAVKPVFSIQSGTYAYFLELNIQSETVDATIYYTLDGSKPNESSQIYNSDIPIIIKDTTTVKAIATGESWQTSEIATSTYTIENTKNISVITSYTSEHEYIPSKAVINNSRLYISFSDQKENDAYGGFDIIDISSSSDVYRSGFYFGSYCPWGIAITQTSGNLILPNDANGIRIFNVQEPDNISFQGSYDCFALDVYTKDNKAYVSTPDSNGGLLILDISDPTNITQLGSYNCDGSNSYVYVEENYAFIVNTRGQNSNPYNEEGFNAFRIINISDPTNPSFVSSYFSDDWVKSIEVKNNFAFVGSTNSVSGGLDIVDISDLSNPTLNKTIKMDGLVDVNVFENYLFVSSSDGIFIYDIQNPSTTRWIGHKDMVDGLIRADSNYIYHVTHEAPYKVTVLEY